MRRARRFFNTVFLHHYRGCAVLAANKHPDRQTVVDLYRIGMSTLEVGLACDLSSTSVNKILKKMAPDIIRNAGGQRGRSNTVSLHVPDATGTSLEHLFSYNPDDGLFRHKTWRGPRGGGPGSIAGCKMINGYIVIGLPGSIKVLAHRLAWLWMTGKWPQDEIDHANGDRSDNRFTNLREADRTQNSQNGGIRSNNSSGTIGVFFDKSRGKYVASIMVDYKTVFRRRYDTLEEAVFARSVKENELFGDFAPQRRRTGAGEVP